MNPFRWLLRGRSDAAKRANLLTPGASLKSCPVCSTESLAGARFCCGCGSEFKQELDSYDAFLSYRRENGKDVATIIKLSLEGFGKTVFMDVDELQSGRFDEKLLGTIERSGSFILVLSTGCLDRCTQKTDWLKREIVHAMQSGRNIIPVMITGFSFPSTEYFRGLPEIMRSLPNYHAVSYDHSNRDAAVRKILRYMQHAPPGQATESAALDEGGGEQSAVHAPASAPTPEARTAAASAAALTTSARPIGNHSDDATGASAVASPEPAPPIEPQPPTVGDSIGSSEDVRANIQRAFAEMTFQISPTQVDGDGNSDVQWRRLCMTHRDCALPEELCRIWADAARPFADRWKAVRFLRESLKTPAGRSMASEILDIMEKATTAEPTLCSQAVQAFNEAAVAPKEKWRRLVHLLPSLPEGAIGDVARILANNTMPEDRVQTADAFLIALQTMSNKWYARPILSALDDWNCRSKAGALREVVASRLDTVTCSIAELLAKWGDTASAPAVRELIELARYGTTGLLSVLTRALLALEGAACVPYLVEVMETATPQEQLNLLGGDSVPDEKFRAAVACLRETTSDNRVRIAAASYLAKDR